jgi:hypothetical protein
MRPDVIGRLPRSGSLIELVHYRTIKNFRKENHCVVVCSLTQKPPDVETNLIPSPPVRSRHPGNSPESALQKEINQLKRVLVEKTLELDFFRGALQKVEARRQKSGISGEKASTPKSKK